MICLYTYKQISELFKVSPATIARWCREDKIEIRYRKLGVWAKEVVIEEREVRKLMRKRLYRHRNRNIRRFMSKAFKTPIERDRVNKQGNIS